jgi:hypothetical protein
VMADRQNMMAIEYGQEEMWRLTNDGRTVRLALPGLRVKGLTEPIKINIDFDAGVVDKMIDRLTILRAQMLPRPAPPHKRN